MGFWGYDVTSEGLAKLENSGLLSRIEKNWDKIQRRILDDSSPPSLNSYNPLDPEPEYSDRRIDLIKAKIKREERRMIQDGFGKKSNSGYNALVTLYQKWKEGRLECPKDVLFYSGSLSKVIGLKDKENFDMDLIEKDRLVAAYCLGKYSEYEKHRGARCWRLNGFKTEIHGDIHGDLMMNQRNLKNNGLYKEIKDKDVGLLNAFYSWWMPFMFYILKYSDTIGHEIKSIGVWRDLIRGSDRWNGEVRKGYDVNDLKNDFDTWEKQFIPQMPDKMNIMEVRKFPLGSFKSNAGYESHAIIDEEKRLVICGKSKEKPIDSKYFTIKMRGCEDYFRPNIYLEPDDIDEVFLGIVSSTCELGNRDSPNDLAALLENWEKIK